jgi:hypothetical protein
MRTLGFFVFNGTSSMAEADGSGDFLAGFTLGEPFNSSLRTLGLGLVKSFRSVSFLVEGDRLPLKHVNRTTKSMLWMNETRKNTIS